MEGDERSKKKNSSLFFLKIDFSFTLRGRLTGRQVGVWIEGGRELKEEGRLFQTQKQMKEVFWWNRLCDGDTHYMCCTHTLAYTSLQMQTRVREKSRFQEVIRSLFYYFFHSAAIPDIDLFYHIVSRKTMFCALVNKYYFVHAYPFSASLAPLLPFQSTCEWFTHYMSHSSSLVLEPNQCGSEIRIEEWCMTVFMFCYPCTFHLHSLALCQTFCKIWKMCWHLFMQHS